MDKVIIVIGIVALVAVMVLFVYGPMKMSSICSREEEARWAKLNNRNEEANTMKGEEVTDVL